ncbi:lethal (2) giant discs 1 isoform X1 [Osmia lignaria lignaria]|uniref:lethal (2) giant discs 1 isoform X1 n=2 Tax=Osmia lignaria lignaria TaxID=1437193 RepID=UPI00402B8B37
MFGKKEKSKRQTRPAGSLAQYGIFDIPENLDNIGNEFMEDDDNNDDLEAELEALTSGDDSVSKPKQTARKPVPKATLDAMIAESIKDINVEEVSDGEDDPELLSELKMITGDESDEKVSPEEEENTEQSKSQQDDTPMQNTITLLQERLKLYQIAEKKAKQENDLGRARRFNRGIKTLKELLHNVQAGRVINEGDIPPELPPSATAESIETASKNDESKPENNVASKVVASIESNTPEEPMPTKTVDEEALNLLIDRQREYKLAAVAWKRAGNMKEALQCISVVKQFDKVIAVVNAGETVDLSDMPSSPNTPGSNTTAVSPEKTERIENEMQGTSSSETASTEPKPAGLENVETALKERLEVYRRMKTAAESEGNSSKVRRYGRICKQFEDALKLHTRGKPVPLDELPTPPGFPPLSLGPQSSASTPAVEKNENQPAPIPESIPETIPESEPAENKIDSSPKSPVSPPRRQGGKKQIGKQTRADKQSALLQQRQHELKQAALNAKKEGDLELARNYLRQAKGIDLLIEASTAGLPVDMNSIPLSPRAKFELSGDSITGQTDDSFIVLNNEDFEEGTATDEEIYENLESQLTKQIKWCLCTRDHSKALGDVPGYNRWERLALGYKRDLDMLRVRKRDALPSPQHHYETKTYAIVQSCTDLSDADIEISIIRGVNYSKEGDTYVMFEFPYPSDNPPSDRTITVKGTCNPEYQAVFPLTGIIDRSSRQCQRAFKRHALKCQVWAKGCSLNPFLCCTNSRGFFRSDSLLGTVTVKLQPLETQCELHDSFPLMDGRKATGGKLELKIRLRNPILTKQIEQITDKWLTIDY